jgi:hypothetical protein
MELSKSNKGIDIHHGEHKIIDAYETESNVYMDLIINHSIGSKPILELILEYHSGRRISMLINDNDAEELKKHLDYFILRKKRWEK